ncbi:MAG: hypothetical protein PHW34_08450 [Hespellia sp.]|nr:hypothetical protein [Hespellia sp.]
MKSIILTDMELCVFALLETSNLKRIKELLPRNVRNRFKWKNTLYIKKNIKLTIDKYEVKGLMNSSDFQRFIQGIFYPWQIYVLTKEAEIYSEIRISECGTYVFQNIDGHTYRITSIENAETYIKDETGVLIKMLMDNVIYVAGYDEFDMLQRKYLSGERLDADEQKICLISKNLEKPMWTIEIHELCNNNKNINVIVWNKTEGGCEFCCTENSIESCVIKIGSALE